MQRFASMLLFAAVALVQVEARGDIKLFDCSKMKSICSAACYYDRELGGDSWMTDGFNYDNSADKESHKSKRRAAIGCKSKNCGSGQSCDEYPFASSYQGGLGVVGGGYPTMRDGFNVCVPQGDQSSQGGQLKGFVSGKPDGYNYEPHVSNAGGIANCDTKQTPSEPATFRHVTTPQNRRRANAQPPIAQGYETQSGVRFVTFGKRDIYSLGTTVWTANTTHPDGGFEEPIVRHFSDLDGFSWE